MIILGVETSCDETAVALVKTTARLPSGPLMRYQKGYGEVLASVVHSQINSHQKFGGVVPEIAAREHLRKINEVYEEALRRASLTLSDVGAIAVTQGPGLIGALLVGLSFAKGLSLFSGLPLIPVDHVHAHIHGALIGHEEIPFPALALVVSGGHTNLYYMEHLLHFQLIAASSDDACGESFDKVASLLGLPYPGGAHVERMAKSGNSDHYPMAQMIKEKDRMEFSYSGLKTKVLYTVRKEQNLCQAEGKALSEEQVASICASFQKEAFGLLLRKLGVAMEKYPQCQSLVISGGVAANQYFRQELQQVSKVPVFFPNLAYCSDNAAMIACLGALQYQTMENQGQGLNCEPYPRYDYASAMA